MSLCKEILILIILSFSCGGWLLGEEKKFVIEGKVPELKDGEMVLVTMTLQGADTLTSAPIQHGAFHMEGSIREPVVALIAVKTYSGGFTFLLDTDAPYRMELYQDGRCSIEGGKLQKALTTYQEIVREANAEAVKWKQQIEKAVQERHYKTKKEMEDRLAKQQETVRKKLQAVMDKNKDNLMAAYILTADIAGQTDVKMLKNRYGLLSDGARQTMPGRMLAARISELEKADVGAVAPDFTLLTPDGREVSLHSVKGKLKILDFWASWCGPCRMENPNMVKLYQDFRERGVEVVSVSLDTQKDKWTDAIRQDGMPWIHVSDLKGWKSDIVKQYGVDAVPFIFVLDGNNRILAKQLRGEKLRTFVEQKLNP